MDLFDVMLKVHDIQERAARCAGRLHVHRELYAERDADKIIDAAKWLKREIVRELATRTANDTAHDATKQRRKEAKG